MTESDFFLQLSLSKASNPTIIYNFDGLNEVANCIIAVANSNPSAKFIIQGSELEYSYIRDKVKYGLDNIEGVVAKNVISLNDGGYIRFCSVLGAITGTKYGSFEDESINSGFYVAFAKDDNEVGVAKYNATARSGDKNSSAIIIIR